MTHVIHKLSYAKNRKQFLYYHLKGGHTVLPWHIGLASVCPRRQDLFTVFEYFQTFQFPTVANMDRHSLTHTSVENANM